MYLLAYLQIYTFIYMYITLYITAYRSIHIYIGPYPYPCTVPIKWEPLTAFVSRRGNEKGYSGGYLPCYCYASASTPGALVVVIGHQVLYPTDPHSTLTLFLYLSLFLPLCSLQLLSSTSPSMHETSIHSSTMPSARNIGCR